MYQQTYISLNFEEIFSTLHKASERNSQEPSEVEQLPQPSYVSNHTQIPPEIPPTPRHYAQTALTRSTLVHNTAQDSRQEFMMRDGSSMSNSLLSRSQIKRQPKASKCEVNAITERLYESRKIGKKAKIETPVKEESIGRENSTDKKSKNSMQRVKSCQNSFVSERSTHKDFGVFDRLFNNSKSKNLREKYQLNTCNRDIRVQKPKGYSLNKKCSQKSLYLTNYVPFYQRLDQELNKSVERANMLQSSFALLTKDAPTFQPKLYQNKYTRTVKSRYMNSPSKFTPSQIQQSDDSILTEDFMDFDYDQLNPVELHFFKKMEYIFTSNEAESVQITEEIVELLTKDEFNIMSVFIMYLQQNPIPKNQFPSYLYSYYHSLSEQQKNYLKNHEAKPKQQYQKMLNSHSRKIKQIEQSKVETVVKENVLVHSFSPQKIAKKHPGNYLLTIQRFT